MRREDIAWSHYHSVVSATTPIGFHRMQEEGDYGYLVVEQCLADGFRSSRYGSRRCEWGRLVCHCEMD